jgi:hypothetical protein
VTIFLVYLAGVGTPFIAGVVGLLVWGLRTDRKNRAQKSADGDRSMVA